MVENQKNIIRTKIQISELRQGMTVEINGVFFTVSMKDVHEDELLGWSYRGDASNKEKEIVRIQFAVKTASGTVSRS